MLNLYVVYDKVAGEAGPVYTAKNDAVARRMYAGLVEREGINRDEYLLIHIGQYDNIGTLDQLPYVVSATYIVPEEVTNEQAV